MVEVVVKVTLFVPDLMGGGAERVMIDLARGLSERNIGVDLVLAVARGPFLEQVPNGVQLVDLGARRSLGSVFRLMSYLRDRQPDVILSTRRHGNLLAIGAARMAGRPDRVLARETNVFGPSRPLGLKERVIRFGLRHAYRRADALLVNSMGLREDLEAFVGSDCPPVHVLPNPIATQEIEVLGREPVRHPWMQGDRKIILGVGSLTPQKDFATLLRAFAVVRQREDARLLIVGEGPERGSLARLTTTLGLEDTVSFPGFVENPFAYMTRSSVFVLSSRWEGSPNVLLQALACGTPVVSTDCPSGPAELLTGDDIGTLVPVGDFRAMAAGILYRLERGPGDRLARNGVLRSHELKAVVARLLPILTAS